MLRTSFKWLKQKSRKRESNSTTWSSSVKPGSPLQKLKISSETSLDSRLPKPSKKLTTKRRTQPLVQSSRRHWISTKRWQPQLVTKLKAAADLVFWLREPLQPRIHLTSHFTANALSLLCTKQVGPLTKVASLCSNQSVRETLKTLMTKVRGYSSLTPKSYKLMF